DRRERLGVADGVRPARQRAEQVGGPGAPAPPGGGGGEEVGEVGAVDLGEPRLRRPGRGLGDRGGQPRSLLARPFGGHAGRGGGLDEVGQRLAQRERRSHDASGGLSSVEARNFSSRNAPWAMRAFASWRDTASEIFAIVAPSRSSWSTSSISDVLPAATTRRSAKSRGSRR